MMDNATFRANMENAVNAANVKCHTPIKDPGIQDLLTRLGELVRTNNGLSYQIRENLFGSTPIDGTSGERAIGCAKDAIEDSIARLAEANDILCYVRDHL